MAEWIHSALDYLTPAEFEDQSMIFNLILSLLML